MSDIYKKAMEIAQHCDVSTPKDSLVLFSISFLPTKENKEKAFEYVRKHKNARMIDHTECGEKLEEMNLGNPAHGLSQDEFFNIWRAASRRLIEQASGNVTAFVENADPRSTFVTTELPLILKNSGIKTINKADKKKFAQRFSSLKNQTSVDAGEVF